MNLTSFFGLNSLNTIIGQNPCEKCQQKLYIWCVFGFPICIFLAPFFGRQEMNDNFNGNFNGNFKDVILMDYSEKLKNFSWSEFSFYCLDIFGVYWFPTCEKNDDRKVVVHPFDVIIGIFYDIIMKNLTHW